MIDDMPKSVIRRGFTLIEIIATMLLMAFGLVSVIGLIQYAARLSAESQTRATAMVTAQTVLVDPQPAELIADIDDANGDDWYLEGSLLSSPFTVRGYINGYYADRLEEWAPSIDGQHRWSWVTVRLFSGGEQVIELKRRMMRRTVVK